MFEHIENLTRLTKRRIHLFVDILLVPICLFAAFALRYGSFTPSEKMISSWPLFPLLMVISALTSTALGLPKIKLHAFETKAILRTAYFAAILTVSAIVLSYILQIGAPRSVPIIFGMLFFWGAVGSRIGGMLLLSLMHDLTSPRTPVAVYGAGAAGIQLVAALRMSREVRPVAFIDDSSILHGITVAGLPVLSPNALEKLSKSGKIERVLLAIPSISQARRQEIINNLSHLPFEVQALPSYVDMIGGRSLVESLRPVSPDDLLGREKVDLDELLVSDTYTGKAVFISGAGGSIGSELCRQVLKFSPSKLVLFELGEFALYKVEQELQALAIQAGVELIAILGDVGDSAHVSRVFSQHRIKVVLHAAAYKHVPLVESNEIKGLQNNVLGTRSLGEAASKAGVDRFILVSTDKAVRPTNIMGASKRLAELMVQDLDGKSKTRFAMVRFGNVLGSSGSVIPLFHNQIVNGGPVTLTHPEVTRFFMTIPEAASLVLTAGSMASGGDVFVLDMGESVKIFDLAQRMIELSGFTLRDSDHPNGDIEIKITGLRPGEKLYEELLIDDKVLPTPHPKILRAQEQNLTSSQISSLIKSLNKIVDEGDALAARALVAANVSGYLPSDSIACE